MDSDIKQLIIICLTICIVGGMGIAGCTYTVTQNNEQYYRNQSECITKGGIWIPNSGNSNAACVAK